METIKFIPPQCMVDLSFWEMLYELKLNKFRIATDEQEIVSFIPSNKKDIVLTKHSFKSEAETGSDVVYSTGILKNVNTANEFIAIKKPEFLNNMANSLWRSIVGGEVLSNISSLQSFVLLTYADLKQYKFTYWFGFPTFVPEKPFVHYTPPIQVCTTFTESDIEVANLSSGERMSRQEFVFAMVRGSDGAYMQHSLGEAWEKRATPDVIFVYSGPGTGTVPTEGISECSSPCPWGLRNVLAMLAVGGAGCEAIGGRVVQIVVLQYAGKMSGTDPLLSILLPEGCFGDVSSVTTPLPRVVGWQPNDRGKPGPRVTDTSSVHDTKKIMSQAVDLNVRLMKWRMWPDLDTELLSSTRCLLLGAGTLGCAVARTLMGWGVRDLTFVDNGVVSYSNPARQSLFEYEDCVARANKSVAAAQRLQKIFPGMRCHGEVLTIPMPGHAIGKTEKETFYAATERLNTLVKEHDVVFALTDSREARWLPTVMCAAHDKLLINSALGFDSYLIMRHGHGCLHDPQDVPSRLGCYFCMDVAAPGNSQRDRTIDQQCTVTRPGLAQIASGFAVEMMVVSGF